VFEAMDEGRQKNNSGDGTLAYPCGGVPEKKQGCYSRLCQREKGNWEGHDGAALAALAGEMKDSDEKRQARTRRNVRITTVPSGYVYFGQFIDHDITKDNRHLPDAIPCVEEIENFRTARLDLECLYGEDPETVSCIYEDDKARLKLGRTLEACGLDGRPIPPSWNDLPRLNDGRPEIVDPRNDENVIVAQLQVLFAKFHNCVLELLKTQPSLALVHEGGLFEKARRFVIWHYQWARNTRFLTEDRQNRRA
jgi:Animal haem peroxidase